MSSSIPTIDVPMLDGIIRERMKEAPQLTLADAAHVVHAQVGCLGRRGTDSWRKRMAFVRQWAADMGVYIEATR